MHDTERPRRFSALALTTFGLMLLSCLTQLLIGVIPASTLSLGILRLLLLVLAFIAAVLWLVLVVLSLRRYGSHSRARGTLAAIVITPLIAITTFFLLRYDVPFKLGFAAVAGGVEAQLDAGDCPASVLGVTISECASDGGTTELVGEWDAGLLPVFIRVTDGSTPPLPDRSIELPNGWWFVERPDST